MEILIYVVMMSTKNIYFYTYNHRTKMEKSTTKEKNVLHKICLRIRL